MMVGDFKIENMSLSQYIERIRKTIISITNNDDSIKNEDERIVSAAKRIIELNPKNIEKFMNELQEKIAGMIEKSTPKEAILELSDYDHFFTYAIEGRDPSEEKRKRILREVEAYLDGFTPEEREQYFKNLGISITPTSEDTDTKNKRLLMKLKVIILYLKEESKELSNIELLRLFSSCGFEFWKLEGMDEFVSELKLENSLLSGPTIDITEEEIAQLNEEIATGIEKILRYQRDNSPLFEIRNI